MTESLRRQLTAAQTASRVLRLLSTTQKNRVLKQCAQALQTNQQQILLANARDLKLVPAGYSLTDRLRLTPARVQAMAKSVVTVQALPDPIGEVIERYRRPTGLQLERVRVPLGVLAVIYEARPNVTVEVFSLAFKTGNAVILKGGRDARYSNAVLVHLLQTVLRKNNLPTAAVVLLNPTDRAQLQQVLTAHQFVDVVIPRGSDRLIKYVREHATVPIIETGAGVCHTLVERSADILLAVRVIVNAKARRCTVCNALDCLVVEQPIARRLLLVAAPVLAKKQVELRADVASWKILRGHYPTKLLRRARLTDFGKEFLAPRLAIKTVPNAAAGIDFIQHHTSQHSEAIITRNKMWAKRFIQQIDAAAVYVNTSTAFTDGFEFGLGSEIGISTQKLHARGPMGLREITTYQWVVRSHGATRPEA